MEDVISIENQFDIFNLTKVVMNSWQFQKIVSKVDYNVPWP
jgi:hypothetical protein